MEITPPHTDLHVRIPMLHVTAAAQRADDWKTYGEEMQRLGELLTRLNRGQSP